ncbi:MAG: bifunctional phosphoglucose/phosphomannose isomerase [Anaerolineales bacterium]
MKLDDLQHIRSCDPEGLLTTIDSLPDQLQEAWELGRKLPLGDISGVRRIIIAGMGGSAIGGDLLAAYAAPMCAVPIQVWRNYDLPAYADGPETLVVASSFSGNTEETNSALERGVETGVQLLVVTTGGRLAERAESLGIPLWRFDHPGPPRAVVGFSFGLLLAAISRLGLIPDPQEDLMGAVQAMQEQQSRLRAEVPVVENPAKRLAGQLVDRWPTIIAADFLAPVARRWRTQIAELAKAVAQFEVLPEGDHNMVAGVVNPEALFAETMIVFLRAAHNHPRNLARIDVTREIMMVEGFNTDVVEGHGDSPLAQQWTALHFGDYVSYYLAMAYGVDPTPVDAIEDLKARLKEFPA